MIFAASIALPMMIAAASMLVTLAAQADSPDTPNLILRGAAIRPVPMAEWEVRGDAGVSVHVAVGAAAVAKAPRAASRYSTKTYDFPSGRIRVLSFKAGSGGVLHKITTETELYVLQGGAEVGIDGKATPLVAGDAVDLPGGILRSGGKPIDTTIVAFSVGNTDPNPISRVVHLQDAERIPIVQWVADGKPVIAHALDEISKAPADAAHGLSHQFGFNSFRLQSYQKGGRLAPFTAKISGLLYIVVGHSRLHIGDRFAEVSAGDAVFEQEGVTDSWQLTGDIDFLGTRAP